MQGGVGGEGIALLDGRSEIVDDHEGSSREWQCWIQALERERMGVSRERDREKTHRGHLTSPIGRGLGSRANGAQAAADVPSEAHWKVPGG